MSMATATAMSTAISVSIRKDVTDDLPRQTIFCKQNRQIDGRRTIIYHITSIISLLFHLLLTNDCVTEPLVPMVVSSRRRRLISSASLSYLILAFSGNEVCVCVCVCYILSSCLAKGFFCDTNQVTTVK